MTASNHTDGLRAFSMEKGAFTRAETIAALGTKAASALSNLVLRGELVSPGRGVYSLPGIREEDPRLVLALERAGSALYPRSRRTSGEDGPATDPVRPGVPETPVRRLMLWMRSRRIASVPEIREDHGDAMVDSLAALVADGSLRRLANGVYAHGDVDPEGPEAKGIIGARARSDAAVTAAIDAARAEYRDRIQDPALADKAVLRLWNPKGLPGDRPELARVYIDMPGYPPFYGQKSARMIDGRSGTISWDSANGGIGPKEAAALARRVFDPVPLWFEELTSRIPDGRAAVVPVLGRTDVHEDVSVTDDPAPVSVEMRHLLPCAYVVSDTERLDPSSLKHPLPKPVTLLVDHRQPQSVITSLRRVRNLEVVMTELPTGGYMVEGRIVIDRMSSTDFDQAIANGAVGLISRAEAMAETGLHRIMLVEGGPYAARHYVLNRLASTLSYLQNIHGIHVTPTMNMRHSTYMVVQAVKHHMFGMLDGTRGTDPLDGARVEADPGMMARVMLGQVHGLSDERMGALIERFGSLRALANAEEDELRAVRGIGVKMAGRIAAIFGNTIG